MLLTLMEQRDCNSGQDSLPKCCPSSQQHQLEASSKAQTLSGALQSAPMAFHPQAVIHRSHQLLSNHLLQVNRTHQVHQCGQLWRYLGRKAPRKIL